MVAIQNGADLVLAAKIVVMEPKQDPEHVLIQNHNIMALPVRNSDLLQKPRIATLAHAVLSIHFILNMNNVFKLNF